MDLLISFTAKAGRLDGAVGAVLDHFRDTRVPLMISLVIVTAAAVLLLVLLVWAGVAGMRIHHLRRLVQSCGAGADFRRQFARVDRRLSASLFGGGWAEFRDCLKESEAGLRYLRRPDEFMGSHAIGARTFPAGFFAAAHGYFIGVGLLFTFIGLVAALKFAAAGMASPDLATAKASLDALLAAASFKFMTSIAGLGSSLLLSVAARIATCLVENEAQGLAGDLERAMAPMFTECLAYDQLAASRAQLQSLAEIGAALAAPAAPHAATAAAAADAAQREAFQQMMTAFVAELRSAAGTEIKQAATSLSEAGGAIMQSHIGHWGQHFADQLDGASTRLLAAATALQESIDGRVGAKVDSLATTLARGEAVFSTAAEKAAGGLLGGYAQLDTSLRSQIASMRDIESSLDRARQVLDSSVASWTRCAAPVLASVEASRQITGDLSQIANQVGSAQHDMAEMAKAIARLSDRVGIVWEGYRSRFEKVDDELQAVFERLQGGTRAFGEEVTNFVGKLDASLANGMQAFSLGTEELRETVQMLAGGVEARAA